MKLFISGDIEQASKVDNEIVALYHAGCDKYFARKNYGGGLRSIGVIFMCHEPALKLKRRVRLSKKDKALDMDIMLDFKQMKSSASKTRRRIIAQALEVEIPRVLSRYKIADFDMNRFEAELKTWIAKLGWK